MRDDIHVSSLDVVKNYNAKLKDLRSAIVTCGALVDSRLRKLKSNMEGRKKTAETIKRDTQRTKDETIKRYKPIRVTPIQGCEIAGTHDMLIQSKFQALESAVNDYNQSINQINNKLLEIGQLTKTFCTIFDSEVEGCNRKLSDMIATMESMTNMKI